MRAFSRESRVSREDEARCKRNDDDATANWLGHAEKVLVSGSLTRGFLARDVVNTFENRARDAGNVITGDVGGGTRS